MSDFVLFGKNEVKIYLPPSLEAKNRLVVWLMELPYPIAKLMESGCFEDGSDADAYISGNPARMSVGGFILMANRNRGDVIVSENERGNWEGLVNLYSTGEYEDPKEFAKEVSRLIKQAQRYRRGDF